MSLNWIFPLFWKDFGDFKHNKTRIAPEQGMCSACPKAEQCLVYTFGLHTLIGKHEKELDEKNLCVNLQNIS